MFYNKAGFPISVRQWTRLFADRSYQQILRSHVGDMMVGTIWTGCDDEGEVVLSGGEPMIFETTVFGGLVDDARRWRKVRREAACWHYSLLEDAWRGHFAAVRSLEGRFPEADTRMEWF